MLLIAILFIGLLHVTFGADAWHNSGKSIGRDFSESVYYSQSNALNESVFDMIVRLNEVSLAIYKNSTKWKKLKAAEEFNRIKGLDNSMIQNDKSLLLRVAEGDMLLDEKDRRIEDMFLTDPKTEFKSLENADHSENPITGQYFNQDVEANNLDDSESNPTPLNSNRKQTSKQMSSKWHDKYYNPTKMLRYQQRQTTAMAGPTVQMTTEDEENPTDITDDAVSETDDNGNENLAQQSNETSMSGNNGTQYDSDENNDDFNSIENNGTLYDEPINLNSNNTYTDDGENDDDEEIIPTMPTNQPVKENSDDDNDDDDDEIDETEIPETPNNGLAMNSFNYSDYKEPYAKPPENNIFVPGGVNQNTYSSNTNTNNRQQSGNFVNDPNSNNVHEAAVADASQGSPVLSQPQAYSDPPTFSYQSPMSNMQPLPAQSNDQSTDSNQSPMSNMQPLPAQSNGQSTDSKLNEPKPTMGANKEYSYNHVWARDRVRKGAGRKRNGMADTGDNVTPFGRKLWITRVVPFIIDHQGTQRFKAATVRQKMLNMMDYISSVTCVMFRQRKATDQQWLHIYYGTGCYAEIGRKFWQRNETKMSLGTYCISEPIMLHLLMHTLGFFHESARPDRNSFIDVNENNIHEQSLPIFNRHFQYDFSVQNSPYDFRSITHFGNKAYSKHIRRMRMQQTIVSKYDVNEPLGGVTLTRYDILHINKLYHCGADYRGDSKYDVSAVDAAKLKTGLSDWTDWSDSCLRIVNQGCVKLRQRVCLNEDFTQCKGVDKYGVQDQFQKCENPKECQETPLVPHWSHWGPPSPCSRTCGDGITFKTRKCDNPAPRNDMTCYGSKRKTTICRVRKCKPDRFDTDFEDGWGAWKLNFQYKMIWQIWNNSASKQKNTGPNHDRFGGSGKYAVLRSRDFWKDVYKIGELLTKNPIDTSRGPKCLTFFFMMNGKSINRLNIFLRVNNRFFKVWQRKGHQGDDWQRGAISLPQSNVEYYIVIDGKTGLPNDSDIAVDDFQLDDGKCPKGIEGCYDYFDECEGWRKRGMCISQFKILIFSCCKTCSGLDYTGKELDLNIL